MLTRLAIAHPYPDCSAVGRSMLPFRASPVRLRGSPAPRASCCNPLGPVNVLVLIFVLPLTKVQQGAMHRQCASSRICCTPMPSLAGGASRQDDGAVTQAAAAESAAEGDDEEGGAAAGAEEAHMADVKLEGPVSPSPPPPPSAASAPGSLISFLACQRGTSAVPWLAGGPGCGTQPCRRRQLPLLHSDGIVCTSRE